jgi:hypothetical protein
VRNSETLDLPRVKSANPGAFNSHFSHLIECPTGGKVAGLKIGASVKVKSTFPAVRKQSCSGGDQLVCNQWLKQSCSI